MKKVLFTLVAFIMCASMQAQIVSSRSSITKVEKVDDGSFGTFYLQYNSSKFDPKHGDELDFNGFSIGYNKAFSVSNSIPLFVETGIGLQLSFYSEEESFEVEDYDGYYSYTTSYDVEDKVFMGSAKIPVNVMYKWDVPNSKISIAPYAGLNFRVNIGANRTISYGDEEEEYDLFDEDDMGEDNAWKRFQAGWQIGVNAYLNKLVLGVSYGSDFSEIAEDCKIKTTSVTLGICF